MINSKLTAIISATALIVLGMAFTSIAANKWSYVDGQWIAVNNDGDTVSEKWVKGDDGIEYYADEDGIWTCNTWSYNDDGNKTYYAGANGKKVKGWLKIEETDEDSDDYGKLFWYHFDESTGKVTTSGVKTISGRRYVFDDNFRMLTGWVADTSTTTAAEWVSLDLTDEDDWALFKDAVYYCGTEDEGWAYSGWQQLEAASVEDDAEDGDTYTYWFYFGANNKICKSDKADDDDTVYQKTIDGEKYTFDRCGRMLTGFIPSLATAGDLIYMGTPASASYANDDGTIATKEWIWAVPVSKTIKDEELDEDAKHWFFGNKNGKITVNCFSTANTSDTYWAFDQNGIMLSGLYGIPVNHPEEKAPTKACTWFNPNAFNATGNFEFKIESLLPDNTVDAYSLKFYTATINNVPDSKYIMRFFYFGDEETDGSMKTGVQTVNIDGTDVEMRFYKKGETYWLATDTNGDSIMEATRSFCVTLGASVDGYNKNGKYYRAGQIQYGDADNYVSFAPIAATGSSANNGKVDVCVPKESTTWTTTLTHDNQPDADKAEDGIYPVSGTTCLVKKDGTIVKNSSSGVRDADGNRYYVKDYVIYQVKLAD